MKTRSRLDMTRILLVQGTNMAYLGQREPEIYGTTTAAELDQMLQRRALERLVDLQIFYTHVEGEAIGRIYQAAQDGTDGLLVNPAGFMHAGYALRDCLRAMRVPYVEVHMSNLYKRGLRSATAETARGTIAGFGLQSYFIGLDALLELVEDDRRTKGKIAVTGSAAQVAPQPETRASSPGILAIWNDRDESIADLYERWYLSEHVPERLAVPGFLAARRYEAVKGAPRFFTRYDVESVDVLSSADYLAKLASPSPLTRQVMASFRNMMRTACVVAYRSQGSAFGGCVVAAFVEQPARVDQVALIERARQCERDARVLGVQVWQAAPDPVQAATNEARLRPGGDRRIEAALVVDVMREEDGRSLDVPICAALRQSVTSETGAGGVPIHSNVYHLLGRWHARV